MTTIPHLRRLGLLIVAASALLWWLTAHTDVFFADGLRYIAQARAIDQGSWRQGFVRSVDHPIYPMAIAAVHRLLGGNDPRDWQTAAQVAAAISGVLLVIPVYLVSLEVFGPASAWLACFLLYLLPFNGHVLADALSESTFLLFWSWGLWAALRVPAAGRAVLAAARDRAFRAGLPDPAGGTHPAGRASGLAHLAFLVLRRRDAAKKPVVGHRRARGGADSRGGSFHDHEGRDQYQAVDSAGARPGSRRPRDGHRT